MRKIFILFLFILTLWQTAAPRLLAASPLQMTAQPGYSGRFKYGEWLPVFVELINSGPDVAGEIQVTIANQTGQINFSTPADLATGARKRFTLYILPNNFSRSARVEFLSAGEVLLTQQLKLSVIPNDRYVIGAVMSNMEGLATLNPPQLLGRRERADVINLSLPDLPEHHEGWRTLNALILNDVDTGGLTPAQRTALSRWVAEGGRLIIGGGAGAGRTLTGLPSELQPVTLTNQVEVETLPGLERYADELILVPGPFLLAQVQPGPMAAILLDNEAESGETPSTPNNTLPLVVELAFGTGRVDFIALDLSQSPFKAWAGVTDFAERLLSPGAAWPQNLPSDVASQQLSDSQMYYALTNLPALDLPSIRFLGLLLIGYILLVGPVNYFVLRWRDRLAWAWVTIPVITLIFSGLAYGVGLGLRGSDIIVNQISIIEMSQTGQTERAQTYVGIFSPRRQSYNIEVGAETLLRPLGQGNYDPWSGSVTSGGTMQVVQTNPARLQGLTVDQWSMQSFAAETSAVTASGVVVELTAGRNSLAGQVTNHGQVAWEDVIVLFNAKFQKLGDLAPGQTAEFELNFQDGSPVMGFGSYVLYQDQFNQPSGPNREITFKQSVLDSTIFNGSRPDLSENPVLIAWQKNNSALDIRLEDYQISTQATTLLYHPLSLNVEGSQVIIPPGFAHVELLASSGDASMCSYGAGLDGSYVYQGTAEARLSLPNEFYQVQPSRLDLYIRTDGSWATLPTLELYDRSTETWVSLEGAKTGSNSIQDIARFYNPADASLQVRISSNGNNTGGCLFLDLALEGERL
jgi:hypothetical protein